jgi:hypothetical protein
MHFVLASMNGSRGILVDCLSFVVFSCGLAGQRYHASYLWDNLQDYASMHCFAAFNLFRVAKSWTSRKINK